MEKRVLYIVMALVLIGLAYVGYNSYDARRAADAKPSETDGEATSVLGSAVTRTTPAEAAAGSQVTQTGQSAQVVPEGDTISPNPPNG